MNKHMTWKRLGEIALTALLGAVFAFMQGLLTGMAGSDVPAGDPAVAATVAVGIKGLTMLAHHA